MAPCFLDVDDVDGHSQILNNDVLDSWFCILLQYLIIDSSLISFTDVILHYIAFLAVMFSHYIFLPALTVFFN
jgi:hypothetical protein